MTTPIRPPKDDLFRAMQSGISSEDGRTLTIRLAPADSWAEIESVTEGHFMERFKAGAYRKTMAENPPKILFQHGRDPQIGEKIIATTDETGEDAISPFARGQILDGVPELVVDGLRKGVYGSSHRFSVVRDEFNPKPKPSVHNPKGLPERTIAEARLFELGAVTWPAYAQASASLRSLTDEFRLSGITADAEHLRNLVNYIDPDAPSVGAAAEPHPEPERRETVAPPTTPTLERKSTVEYVTRDEKSSRVTELKAALARQAVEYPGVLPADAQATWDADSSELETLERDIKAWDERQTRLAAYANDPAKVERTYEPVASFARKTESDIYDLSVVDRAGSQDKRDQMLRDNAMRSVEQASFPHPNSRPDEARDHLAELLDYRDTGDKELARRVLLTGNPTYRRAFNKALLGVPLSPEEQRAAALAVVGTTTTGGYAVPYVFDPTIVPIGAWTSINPYRQACRVETIVGGNVFTGVASGAITAVRTTEAAVAVEAGPTFEQPTCTVKRVQTLVTYSFETEQDRPDIASEMAVLINDAKDTEEESAFTLGTGAASAPFGMFGVHATTNGFWPILDTAAAAFAIGDLYVAEATLPIRHRMNAAWFMSRGTIRLIQAVETVSGELFGGQYYGAVGNPVATPSGNTGLKLLGYPVWEVPSAVSTTTVADSIYATFGNPQRFVVVDRAGMDISIIPHILNGVVPTGQRGLYAMWRNSAFTYGAAGAPTTGGLRLTVKS